LITRAIRLSSYHNIQTEDTLNPDLPTIPLITILQSTDNFSEVSKLGEGGFGPVYKVLMIWTSGYRLFIFIIFQYAFID